MKISVAAFAWLSCQFAMSGCASLNPQQTANDVALFDDFHYVSGQNEIKPAVTDYLNPILAGYYPDPSIARVGGDFYLVNSSFTNFPGLPIFHSTDLVSWRQIGNAIDRPTQMRLTGRQSSQGIYAPDISFNSGLFYLVSTCVGCNGNFVMTATNPAGPWSDPVWLPFDGIDPSIFWDTDGKAYIVNNGPPEATPLYEGHRAIWIQEFDPKMLQMVGGRTLIVNGGSDIKEKPIWIEGPHMFRKDGAYYLIAAEGGTGPNHSQVVFRSTSPHGPFTPYQNNPILTQRTLDPARPAPVTSAGHAKLVQTPEGDWWAVFLATRPYEGNYYNTGRETFLLPVSWKDGWPIILESGRAVPKTVKRPALPVDATRNAPLTGPIDYTEAFNGKGLGPAWIGFRTPSESFARVSGGKLQLISTTPFGDLNGTPSFIGRRLQHNTASVSVTLDYRPSLEGDRAGLMAVQSDRSYVFFGITRLKGETVVAVYTRDKTDVDTLEAYLPISPKGPIGLEIHFRDARMDFKVIEDGNQKSLKTDLNARLLSTERAGGFTGTIVGPYVYTPGN